MKFAVVEIDLLLGPSASVRPNELPRIQPWHFQSDAYAVVDKNLESAGAKVELQSLQLPTSF
jgi:hypothetical protein